MGWTDLILPWWFQCQRLGYSGQKSDFDIIHHASDDEGRYLVLKITKGDESYILANIYTPTQDSPLEQISLIDSLEEKIVDSGESNVLLGGDFNLCLDQTLDRSSTTSGSVNRGLQYRERILSLLEGLNLIDVWRDMNPGVMKFTFRRSSQSSRLDYWIVSEHLFNLNTVTGMEPEPLSDHLYVSLQIGCGKPKKGPGVWRHTSLLANPEYIQKITDTINKVKQETGLDDLGLTVEWMKYKLRGDSIQFAKQLYQKRKGHDLQLKEAYLSFQKNWIRQPPRTKIWWPNIKA